MYTFSAFWYSLRQEAARCLWPAAPAVRYGREAAVLVRDRKRMAIFFEYNYYFQNISPL